MEVDIFHALFYVDCIFHHLAENSFPLAIFSLIKIYLGLIDGGRKSDRRRTSKTELYIDKCVCMHLFF